MLEAKETKTFVDEAEYKTDDGSRRQYHSYLGSQKRRGSTGDLSGQVLRGLRPDGQTLTSQVQDA